MKKIILTRHFIAASLLFCMILSLFSGSAPVHAQDRQEPLLPDGSLPVVYLNIDESQGTIEDMLESGNHSVYCYGTVSIEVPQGFHYTDFPDLACESVEGLVMSIRGRGNSTWERADKKAFKIKLDKKADLFGFGKNKHWVLLANALDETLLRNRISTRIGDQLGFEFTPRGVPVDVILKGEQYGEHYIGSYYLSENVRVDTNRLEIDELTEDDTEEPDITGGYLLQHGLQVNPWSPDRFFTKRGVLWATHTPSFDVDENLLGDGYDDIAVPEDILTGAELEDAYENPAQQEYIQRYMQMVEDTLYEGGTAYRELFDLRSAALYWWAQEFPLNADSYRTGSYYVYKKRDVDEVMGKLFTGPLWDFDFAWDNQPQTQGYRAPHQWLYPMFCDHEEGGFPEIVKQYWPEFRACIVELIKDGGVIDQYYEESKTSAALDHEIWHPEEKDFDYKKEVDELKTWIIDRLAWVDENIDAIDNVAHTLTFMADDEVYDVVYQEDGQLVTTDVEAPVKEGHVFIGWQYEDGTIAEEEFLIRRDVVLTAKYLRDDEVTHGEDILFRKNNDIVQYNTHVSQYAILHEVVPTDAIDKTVEWTSSNEDFATVDQEGYVSFHGPGEVTITAKLKNGVSRDFHLTVVEEYVPVPESVYALEETVYMNVGDWKALVIDTVPSPAKINGYTYTSDDEAVVTVDNFGLLTAAGPGETDVHLHTISYDPYGGDPIELDVTVHVIVTEKEEITYTIVNGENPEWTKGSEEGISITVKNSKEKENSFSHFKDVYIDGNRLEKGKDYTAVSGSTVITISRSYLESLKTGEYALTIEFDNGKAETKLTIIAASPDTAVHQNSIWFVYLPVSMITFLLAFVIKRKLMSAN